MKSSLMPLLLLILSLAYGCKKSDDTLSPQSTPPIVPLKLGNIWTYTSTNYDTMGSITGTTEYSVSVLKDTSALGTTLFAFSTLSPNFLWHANTDSGLVWFKYMAPTPYPLLKYKYPALVGDAWYNGDDTDVRVALTDTVVVTQVGTSHCIKYEGFSYMVRWVEFLSPGVGKVRSISYTAQNVGAPFRLSRIDQLKSYQLN